MSDDSDDIPLIQRRVVASEKPAVKSNGASKPIDEESKKKRERSEPEEDDGDGDGDEEEESEEEGDDSDEDGDEEDDLPLAKRQSKSKSTPNAKRRNVNGASTSAAAGTSTKRTRTKKSPDDGSKSPGAGGGVKWNTLKHAGVLFPPDYVPHGKKMLYDGKPVDLTPEQEEVASLFAALKEDDPYRQKPVFLKNFWEGFKAILGPNHVIKSFEKCDFKPMTDYFEADREAKKTSLTKEAKAEAKKAKDQAEEKYKVVHVDGRAEQNGNFRVEPPGLFRGRGEHPLMGKVKRRIFPRDIIINIGKGEPVPEHPYPGQSWMRVQHDQTVTWLAKWNDPVLENGVKYVMLSATSFFKADSDRQKYEKARQLKSKIVSIRKDYEAGWSSTDLKEKQMSVALYFLDKLALRAGHEKEEDEAETVGCCTLKCGNVEVVANSNKLKFDFLGKDSIRYENEVEVHPKVYANVEKFKKLDRYGKRKENDDMLFETFDATDLNKKLKDTMPGLSAKVFRTYNASITLQTLLLDQEKSDTPTLSLILDERKANYDKANKEVAILCNHQRAAPRGHVEAMGKVQAVLQALYDELDELKSEMKKAGAGGKEAFEKKIEKKKQAIAKKEIAARSKEDLKTVALGTSKINYMDPRITIAWCKRNEVPIEKVFPKTLMGKFGWAMEIEPEFIF